jgi:hypothetical protein
MGAASSSQAATLFQVDSNPGGTKLFLDKAKDSATSAGAVVTTDDVGISVVGNADFANGFSTITPIKNGLLTTLIFTPTNSNAFDSFSFRGQDLTAGATIDVIIQDNQGNAPVTIAFTQGDANADFTREGIITALTGETIKSVELYNSSGFKEAKQFEFGQVVTGGVPEPATWAVMLLGFGGVGAAMRSRRRATFAAV